MKQLLLILFLSFLGETIYSQPFGDAAPGYKITRLQYENSSGEKGTTYFQYNKQNKLIKAIWMLDDRSRNSTNYYEYDSKGNLIATFRDFSDGITSFERFDYDESGNKVSEYFYRSDSISGFASYNYKNNLPVEANLNNYKGWLSGKLEFKYNTKYKKEKGFLWKSDSVMCKIQYDYDSIGNLIREFWDFSGKWSQTFNYIYTKIEQPMQFYSSPFLSGSSNFRISKENYTFNNEIGGPSQYVYNEQGLLETKVFMRNDSLQTNTFYEYDSDRKLVASKRIYSDSSEAKFTYVYDENNKLILRNFFRADTLYGFEMYLYDSEEKLIKAYWKNFDSWLSGTIDFESDEFGKIARGVFDGQNNFNAVIYFFYNQENLVSRIKWEFSFGKYQEYQFEYENINSP